MIMSCTSKAISHSSDVSDRRAIASQCNYSRVFFETHKKVNILWIEEFHLASNFVFLGVLIAGRMYFPKPCRRTLTPFANGFVDSIALGSMLDDQSTAC